MKPPRACARAVAWAEAPPGSRPCARCGLAVRAEGGGLWWCSGRLDDAGRPPRVESGPPDLGAALRGAAQPTWSDAVFRSAGATGSWEADPPSPAVSAPAPASRFPGYRPAEVIGRGGGGVVYRADPIEGSGEPVAIKVLRGGAWASPAQRARFQREIAVASRLDDPGLVPVLASGLTPDGAPWYAMPLVRGPSLADVLASPVRPPWCELARVVAEVARTLDRLHARGISHRDVKPGNILLTEDGRPLLTDFGLALSDEATRLTRGPAALGTPAYMAPEQLSGAVERWPLADVYSLGRVLASLLAGEAWTRPGSTETEPPPRALAWIAALATAHEPSDRLPSAGAVADLLDRWRKGGSLAVLPGVGAARVRVALRQRDVRVAALVGAALVAGLLASGAVAQRAWRERAAAARWDTLRDEWLESGADGPGEAALQRVRDFVASGGARRTEARQEALAALAEVSLARADVDAALSLRAEAVSDAPDARWREADLRVLADTAWRARRFEVVQRLLALHDAEDWGAFPPDDPLRARAALARRDLAGAGADPAARALVAPFLAARPVDLDGTVGGFAWTADADHPPVVDAGISAPRHDVRGWRLPAGWSVLQGGRDGHPVLAVDPALGLWRLDAGGARRIVERLPRPVQFGLTVAGRVFLLSSGPSAVLLEARDGAVVERTAGVAGLTWWPLGLAAADLDGDGAVELVASLGPPDGLGLRAWRLVPDGLEPLAAGRLGYLNLVGVLPARDGHPARVVANRTRSHPAPDVFGEREPDGGPCGLVVAEARGGRFAVVQEVPLRVPEGVCVQFSGTTADLDGDGVDELIAGLPDGEGEGYSTWIFRQDGRGLDEDPLILRGLEVRAVGGAPSAPSFIVDTWGPGEARRTWRTRAGGPGIPAWPAPPPGSTDVPCAPLQHALGLDAAVARSCEEALAGSPSARAAMLAVAARAWLRAGQPGRAWQAVRRARALDPASVSPDLAARALAAAARADPSSVATAPLDLLEPELRRWVAARAAPDLALDLRRPLPAALEAVVPAAVEHDLLDGRLRLRLPVDAGTLVRLPLRATGGPAWLRLSGTWLRGEWGAHASLRLRRVGGEGVDVDLSVVGSGRQARREIQGACLAKSEALPVAADRDLAVEVGWSPDGTELWCRTRLGEAVHERRQAAPPGPRAGEAWELVLVGEPPFLGATGQRADLAITALEIGGMTAVEAPPTSRDPWLRWVLEGGEPPARPDLSEADLARLVPLARLYPDLVERVGRVVSPRAAGALLAGAWTVNAAVHPDDPLVRASLRHPAHADRLPAEAAPYFALARGAALTASGELDAAVEALEAAGASPWARWSLRAEAAARLAEIAMVRGEEAAARRWAEVALAAVPDRDLGRRRLRNRPRFALLADDPGWADLWSEGGG